jgi:PAS domain S-box-containing protein
VDAVEQIGGEMLASLVENADDAVIVADPAGAMRYANAAAEAMFGHPREQLIGASLDLIIPEGLRERHWEGYRTVMETGETRYAGRMLAVPALRADGTRISVEFTVTLLRDPEGRVAAIAAILRDVTTRWEEGRRLQRRLQDLEREVAAHEARAGGAA